MNSIDIFPRDNNFNAGLPKVDEQHRKLVELLNVLETYVAFAADLPQLNAIFDELADYTDSPAEVQSTHQVVRPEGDIRQNKSTLYSSLRRSEANWCCEPISADTSAAYRSRRLQHEPTRFVVNLLSN